MDKQQKWGIAGCALLLLGGFAPLVSMGSRSVCFYDLPFFYLGTFVAVILGSGYLIWKQDYKPLMLTAMVCLLLVFLKYLDAMSMPAMVDISYGWLVLLAGIYVLKRASGFKWRDGLTAMIPRDVSGAARHPAAPPPPVGLPTAPSMAPPPPPGAMPPPPPSAPLPPVPGAPICVHCQAPVSAGAKFCRACGGPLPAPVSATPPPVAPPAGRVCRQCGAPLSATAKFCRGCGTPAPASAAPPANCPGCGAPLEPAERFCSGCGQKIIPD
jgi:ribosomal protein L40E